VRTFTKTTARTAKTRTAKTKTRLHAVTATAALAFLAGLTGPAAQAFAADPAPQAAPATHTAGTVAPTTVEHVAAAAAQAVTGKPAAPAAKPAGWAGVTPSAADLFTTGKPAGQSTINLTPDQMRNARAIVQAGQALGLQPRAWVIAVSTSLQESKLTNLGDLGSANDHDSLGLFQQRPTSGWGTAEEINNPTYAATAFYKALTQVQGWQSMAVTDAAQAVQVSAFGDAYAQWEQQAGDIISGLYGYGPYAQLANQAK
jgi:hypothetical protein